MNVDQFIAKYNGVHIDEDGYYGAQCWDVVARYAREVVGCPSFPTGSGGAEGLYRLFQNPIPQYFDRIANDPNDPNQLPQKGDVMVWTAAWSPPYGHTALVISADSSGPTVLEQNGNNPGGAAYIKERNWTGVYGWLRPKNKGINEMIEDQDVDILRIGHSEIGGWDFGETHLGKLDGLYLASWKGKSVKDFIRAQWNNANSEAFRNHRVAIFRDEPTLRSQITELSKRPTQDELAKVTTVKEELVKVNNIKDGEIKRLSDENAALAAKAGDVNLTVKQAIKVLYQTIIDAIKG